MIGQASGSLEGIQRSPDAFQAFRIDALRAASIAYLAWLILWGGLAVLVFLVFRHRATDAVLPSLFVYYSIAIAHVVRRIWRGRAGNIMAPDVFVLLFYTLFHLGYVTLYGVGLAPYSEKVFYFDESIPSALLVVNLGLIGFLFGYELFGGRAIDRAQLPAPRRPTDLWPKLGTAIMVVGLIAHIAVLSAIGLGNLQKHGYYAISWLSRFVSPTMVYVMAFSGFALPLGLMLQLIGSALRYGKLFRSKLALALAITCLILFVMEGDRGPIVQILGPIILIQHYFVKRIRIPYLAGLLVAALLLFSAIALVRSIAFDPSGMLAEFQYQQESSDLGWMSPLIEMGGSFLTVDITCHEVPSQEPYWMGASWFTAVLHVVPFLQGWVGSQGWTRWAPSIWLTVTYFGEGAAGRGFTLAAEGYLNFGYPGAVVEPMLLGIFVRRLFIKLGKSPTAAWAFVFFGCLGASMMMIRNHVNVSTSMISQVFVSAYLLNMFLGNEPAMAGAESERPAPHRVARA